MKICYHLYMRSRKFAKKPREIVVIAHNIRSVFNVGSIFRTSEGFGISRIFLSGYTPNFEKTFDPDSGEFLKILPHQKTKLVREIHKTALGAEEKVPSKFHENLNKLLDDLANEKYLIVGLEQNSRSVDLAEFAKNIDKIYSQKFTTDAQEKTQIALILGEEVHGLTEEIINKCDALCEIPMFGEKESFNVSVSCGIALYEISTK